MFKQNFNRFFYKSKLFFRKNFFFKNNIYFNNKKLILDSFLVKNKSEFYFSYNNNTKKNNIKDYNFFLIRKIIKKQKKIIPFKNNKIILWYKITKHMCKCFFHKNFFLNKKINKINILKKKKTKLNKFNLNFNFSFIILFNKKLNIRIKNLFKSDGKVLFKKILNKRIFKNNINNRFKINFFLKNKNYLDFIKTLNTDKIYNNPYTYNTFISFNFIKYYSNQRLVKQPICILNYKLTSIYNNNSSTRIFKNYLLNNKRTINYHSFLKKFYFNLKKTSYKFFGLNQTYHFFNFLYKTHFKLFV